jgi:hypothetical protein
MEEEKTYGYFIQDGVTAHTANYSLDNICSFKPASSKWLLHPIKNVKLKKGNHMGIY